MAVSDRPTAWVTSACAEYAKRLPARWKFREDIVSTSRRAKGSTANAKKEEEAQRVLAKIDSAEFVVALDEGGSQFSSRALASRMQNWDAEGLKLVFVIGGPDGLSPAVLSRANLRWSLSALTLPHGLARILVLEQLYRAFALNTNHPYHRD